MYYFRIILSIVLFVILAYFFVQVIYGKIMVHNIRIKMQKKGQIPKHTNINIITFWNMLFWMIPLSKYLEQGNEEHKKWIKKVNYSLMGMFIIMIIFWIIMYSK